MYESMEAKENYKVDWNTLRNEALVYELSLPQNVDAIPKGQEFLWTKGSAGNYDSEKAHILEVCHIFTNPKDTVKIVILGDHRILTLSRMHRIDGFHSLKFDRYNNTTCDVFDNIQKGTWVIIKSRYSGSDTSEVAFITNEKSLDIVKEMIEALWQMEKARYGSGFRWQSKDYEIETDGTVRASDVFKQKTIFYERFRHFKWIHRKERWDLMNAVRANLSMKKLPEQKLFEVTAKALDGKTYYLKCPILEKKDEVNIGYRDNSLYELDFWLPFVYREKNDNFFQRQPIEKTQELVNRFIQIFHKLPRENFTFAIDNRPLSVERKLTKNEALLNYIDGKLVKSEGVIEKLSKFFILGEPIIEEVIQVSAEGEETKKTRVMSIEAKKLIDEGLNGKLKDLEGEFPFHLNILYKEEEKKWYLEIAGKKFYVKGGYGALSKVQNAIKGTAIIDHSTQGYDPRATQVIRGRLAELVEDENAVFIILQVKKMGALMKALSGE